MRVRLAIKKATTFKSSRFGGAFPGVAISAASTLQLKEKSMNFRSFTSRTIALAAFAVSAPALAQFSGTTCSGCTPPSVGTGLNLTGLAGTSGTAITLFEGPNGSGKVNSDGSSSMDIVLNAAGSACPGGCEEASYTVNGKARQLSTAIGAASSRVPGVQAGVSSLTSAQAIVGFIKGQ